MVFSSFVFIFAFLPIVMIVYFVLSNFGNTTIQHVFLTIASLFFYAYFNISYLWIILASIVVNYILAKAMCGRYGVHCAVRKLLLILGILFNLGMLGYFKYYNFFISNLNTVFATDFTLKHIVLPLGISFFTFQQFSFLISIYKKEEEIQGFVPYALFVTFFPQLVAGPIVLYSEMMPQFLDPQNRYLNYNNISKGIYIFAIGLFKKLVIADTVALYVNNGFSTLNPSLLVAWVTMLLYAIQIYFDFSGYSNMAIGLGLMFNIKIPINFDSPYKAESVTVFWRKWHITLGRALSTYVYIPLGGNRAGKFRHKINLFLTFLASGLWHGASWLFILWGALHGVFVVLENIFKKHLKKMPRILRIVATFLVVCLLWVLFRATSFDEAINLYRGLINFNNIGFSSIGDLAVDGLLTYPNIIRVAKVLFFLVTSCILVFIPKNTIQLYEKFSPSRKHLLLALCLLVLSVLHLSRESIFIYFNF